MSKAQSINPHNNELLGEYTYISNEELTKKIEKSHKAFEAYRQVTSKERSEKLAKLGQVLTENANRWGEIIAKEQGKPLSEAVAEVKKAAGHAIYYSKTVEEFVREEVHNLEFKKSVVEYHPIGSLFFVAPFNFPFWLIFKGVIPALAMGNTVISKTASVCPQVGLAVQECFDLAGFNNGEYQYVLTTQEQSELIISHPYIKGVSFTGSTQGGSSIASLAGKYLKKTVMELGGSDPFIVLGDADVDLAVTTALASRLRNGGQVCTCAKRFLIHENVYEEFRDKLTEKVKNSKVGNPLDQDTKVGPLTKPKVVADIKKQVDEGVKQGAKLLTGGKIPEDEELKKGNYYLPAVLEVFDEQNILFREETFGPVFPLMKLSKDEDFVRIANDTEYGLGGIIISKDVEKAQKLGSQIDVGALFYNAPVSADSRLPSGGTKNSGFGRECGPFGVREFCNIKTVVIK